MLTPITANSRSTRTCYAIVAGQEDLAPREVPRNETRPIRSDKKPTRLTACLCYNRGKCLIARDKLHVSMATDMKTDETMKKTPFAIIALTAVVALSGYAVCNRPSRLTTATRQGLAPEKQPAVDSQVQSRIDDLCTKWDAIQTITAVIHTRAPGAAGYEGSTKGEGNYAYQKTDGNPLLRLHLRNMFTIHKETTLPDGRISPRLYSGEVLVFLHDGNALWNQITQVENKKIYKRRYDSSEVLQLGGRALWDTLTAGTNVKMLPDEKVEEVNNTDANVFSVVPLDGDWTSTHWFDKKTGLRLKTVEKDLSGEDTLTLWLAEINYAPEFAEDRFVFQISDGWEVIDETVEKNTKQDDAP